MQKKTHFLSLSFLLWLTIFQPLCAENATQIILTKRAAVSVSPVRLYADSMYTKSTETTFTEGVLFEVLSETNREHFDNTQNQTFRWFKVRSLSGAVGWVFGDNLAVVTPEPLVENPLKPFYKKTATFDNGFEKATIWLAHTEGHDVPTPNRPEAAAYSESYFIVTNAQGRSVLLNYANSSETSRKTLQSIHLHDLTDNRTPEIIIETTARPQGSQHDERVLEVFTFKLGNLQKIFEERLTLTWERGVPSPALAKSVDIEGATVRVAYIDFLPCEKISQNLTTDIRSKTQERCLEQVTYSLAWDKTERDFKPLYKESRRTVQGAVIQSTTLKNDPSVLSSILTVVQPDARLQVIKHFENLKLEDGKKVVETWLYVRHPSGVQGYLRANEVVFKNTEHANLLKAYYEKPPLMKQDWTSEAGFLKVGN